MWMKITFRQERAFAAACHQQTKLAARTLRRSTFTLQWHITDHCNLNCRHCYQENVPLHDASFSDMLLILEQFDSLLAKMRNTSGGPMRGHVNLTGGEPFLNNEFWDLLSLLSSKNRASYAILSNGTLIDSSTALQLKKLKPAYVQVSLEGSPKTHDHIRGEGSFDRAASGISCLVTAGIPVSISFTAHRGNYTEFPQVVRYGRKLGASRIWADRLIPCGHAASLTDDLLTPDETLSFFEIMKTGRKKKWPFTGQSRDVAMHRALQFLVGNETPYHCHAGNSLLTILANGDVVPCRRLPVVSGNVLDRELSSIYFENPFLKSLRDPDRISKGCEECFYQPFCRGGLRCLSYAVKGDAFSADPGCWIANHRTTNNSSLIKLRSCG